MADSKKPAPGANDGDDMKYYRSRVHGMSVIVGDPDESKGEVAPKSLRFVPYWEQEKGRAGRFKMGYLKTKMKVAQKKLDSDPNVENIGKEEYYAAVKPAFDESKTQYAGLRAPYQGI